MQIHVVSTLILKPLTTFLHYLVLHTNAPPSLHSTCFMRTYYTRTNWHVYILLEVRDCPASAISGIYHKVLLKNLRTPKSCIYVSVDHYVCLTRTTNSRGLSKAIMLWRSCVIVPMSFHDLSYCFTKFSLTYSCFLDFLVVHASTLRGPCG